MDGCEVSEALGVLALEVLALLVKFLVSMSW